jgi:cell division protein ZapA (FtsZ GTPase activity inhibitor)
MSTFTPLDIEGYKKTHIPQGVESQREYLDQQFRQIEKALKHLRNAVEQLQDEQALIWTALNNLGETRP